MELKLKVGHADALFFELVQVAIGRRSELSTSPTAAEWEQIYQLCRKHSLVGIGFCGMRLLPERQSPPISRVINWAAQADAILQENAFINDECHRLFEQLSADGLEGRIIKGQSNYFYYPSVYVSAPIEGEEKPDIEPLGSYRTAGDIDVLLRPDTHQNCIKDVIEYCIREAEKNKRHIHHIYYHDTELCWSGKTEVEAHYRAIWLNAPWRNVVLQRWLKSDEQWLRKEVELDGHRFYVATSDFNIVYQLLHIYKHLFEEGIGLRQLMDYYMVLCRWTEEHQDELPKARTRLLRLLHQFDCDKFCGAMMYVLHAVFALPVDVMVCPIDETRGRFLLSEVLRAGNFGHYDERLIGHREYATLWHAWDKLGRNMKYVTQYPEEVLGEPLFSIYHWCWRTFRLWRF